MDKSFMNPLKQGGKGEDGFPGESGGTVKCYCFDS